MDLVIKGVSEMQSSIKGHHHSQHSIKASSAHCLQPAQSFTCWREGMNQELDYNSCFSSTPPGIAGATGQLTWNPQKKALFKDSIWHAKCPGCMGNNLILTVVNSSPFFLNNNPGLSVALYKWSWMGIFRPRTWMRNHFSGSKISSSQWLHSKHSFSHSWNYLKYLMLSQRHSSFSWDKKAKVQGNNLKWSELFLQQGT